MNAVALIIYNLFRTQCVFAQNKNLNVSFLNGIKSKFGFSKRRQGGQDLCDEGYGDLDKLGLHV